MKLIRTEDAVGHVLCHDLTQIGKECHSDCPIKKAVGRCVMPTEGIFAVVVKEGAVRAGDAIEVLEIEHETH